MSWRPYPNGSFPTPDLTTRPPVTDEVTGHQQQSPCELTHKTHFHALVKRKDTPFLLISLCCSMTLLQYQGGGG